MNINESNQNQRNVDFYPYIRTVYGIVLLNKNGRKKSKEYLTEF